MQAVQEVPVVDHIQLGIELRNSFAQLQTALGRYLAGAVAGDVLGDVKSKIGQVHNLLSAMPDMPEELQGVSREIGAVKDFLAGHRTMMDAIESGKVFEKESSTIMGLALVRITNSFDMLMNTASGNLIEQIGKVQRTLK